MKTLEVTMVRVYLTEGEGLMKQVLSYLHDDSKVRGVTVFRGITGFGRSGKMHSSNLVDLSLDLPLTIEFFDQPAKVDAALQHLNEFIEPDHIVCWPAKVIVESDD